MPAVKGIRKLLSLGLLSILSTGVLAGDILSTNGFSTCTSDPSIKVSALNVQYNRKTRQLVFDVAGASEKAQNVSINMIVSAYGKQVYQDSYNPCTSGLPEMCPGK